MHLPRGFYADDSEQRSDYVLQLRRTFMIQSKQASHNWSELLKVGLLELGFKQSIVDPCLYSKDNIICTIYVDDAICWSPDDSKIDQVISRLKGLNFELTGE